MYKNIGAKIKVLAVVIAILGIVFSISYGLLLISDNGQMLTSILIIILGSLASWVGSFVLFSWGEVVENVKKQTEIQKETAQIVNDYICKQNDTKANVVVSKIESVEKTNQPSVKTLEQYIQETENNDK